MYIFRKITLQLVKMNNLTLFLSTFCVIGLATISMYLLERDNFGSLFRLTGDCNWKSSGCTW